MRAVQTGMVVVVVVVVVVEVVVVGSTVVVVVVVVEVDGAVVVDAAPPIATQSFFFFTVAQTKEELAMARIWPSFGHFVPAIRGCRSASTGAVMAATDRANTAAVKTRVTEALILPMSTRA